MSVDAIFDGGPCDGEELALIGAQLPPYLLMMANPSGDSPMTWLVVGAGFDDHWPDQHRYELDVARTHVLVAGDGITSGEAVYRYVEPVS